MRTGYSGQVIGNSERNQNSGFYCNLQPATCNLTRGFTFIETLVAITLLTVAIIAPMALTTQSLSTAYYARDQIIAFHLAQEAIESVRHARDANVLKNAFGTQADLLTGIPIDTPFTVDTTQDDAMATCPSDGCLPLKTNGQLYGYGTDSSWTPTLFTRSVLATAVRSELSVPQEIRVSVTVRWQTGSFQTRSFTISENLFRWVNDGSAAL